MIRKILLTTISFFIAWSPVMAQQVTINKEVYVAPSIPISEFVTSWASKSVTQAFTMDFANYKQELMKSRENFTPTGWSNFNKALQDSQVINSMLDHKFVITAKQISAPIIEQEGDINGVYTWTMQIPIVLSYNDGINVISHNYIIKAVAIREAETDNPRGIGIKQVIVSNL